MTIRNGRLGKEISNTFLKLNSSLEHDRRLAVYDILGSIAYAKALNRSGIITDSELKEIIEGLTRIKNEILEGKFKYRIEEEDIHMNIERRLEELIGKPALKLHTGRSRNEQIVLDERLYLIDEVRHVKEEILTLMDALCKKADETLEIIIPSYTHLQQAQPISVAHLFMAYYQPFLRNLERLLDYEKRLKVMPLGSGAVAGSTNGIDRDFLMVELGFEKISRNSVDTVAARDFITEFIFIASLIFETLSRISEDLIIYSSTEFGYIVLPDELTTTSSLMPQKKNPDSLELIRGKTSKIFGNLVSVLTLLKGLPYTYNRDMQEDKPPLNETVDLLNIALPVMTEVISGLKVVKEGAEKALNNSRDFIYATDIADYLVKKGLPFREAHRIVGNLVRKALKENKKLSQLNIKDLKELSDLFDDNYYRLFNPVESVNKHNLTGGTALSRVKEEIERAKIEVSNFRKKLEETR